MGVFAYIKNGVKYKMNQFPGAYPANRVSYNGSDVETALDELNADLKWKYLDEVALTGGTGATNSKQVTVPNNAREYLIQTYVGSTITSTSTMLSGQTDAYASSVGVTSNGAVASNYGGHFNATTGILEAMITYRSGSSLSFMIKLYYR